MKCSMLKWNPQCHSLPNSYIVSITKLGCMTGLPYGHCWQMWQNFFQISWISAQVECTSVGYVQLKVMMCRSLALEMSWNRELVSAGRWFINQSINQKRIKVTKVTNVTARPLSAKMVEFECSGARPVLSRPVHVNWCGYHHCSIES